METKTKTAANQDYVNSLRKSLYVAVSMCVAPRFKNDGEEVKRVRDEVVEMMFCRNYKELTTDELHVAIEYFNNKSKPSTKKASLSQLKLLRHYQFHCACVYADFQNAMFKIDGGKIISGQEVRTLILTSLEKNERIPPPVFRFLYETWINPTSHKMMLEGELRVTVKNKTVFHYEYLLPGEANYLLQRYGQMYIMLNDCGKLDFKNAERLN